MKIVGDQVGTAGRDRSVFNGGRDRSTARLTLGVGLAVSAFPLSVPV